MIPHAIHKIKSILDSFLGDSKRELNETYQLQYACPCCRENKGSSEDIKKNLEINLKKQNLWVLVGSIRINVKKEDVSFVSNKNNPFM